MIVEDSLITSLHLEWLVTDVGYQVCAKTDYAEQVEEIHAAQMPDLILMDIMLSGIMSGVDAAEQLRQSSKSTPIVFISALSDADTQSRIEKIPNSALIPKPFDHNELVSTINKLLN